MKLVPSSQIVSMLLTNWILSQNCGVSQALSIHSPKKPQRPSSLAAAEAIEKYYRYTWANHDKLRRRACASTVAPAQIKTRRRDCPASHLTFSKSAYPTHVAQDMLLCAAVHACLRNDAGPAVIAFGVGILHWQQQYVCTDEPPLNHTTTHAWLACCSFVCAVHPTKHVFHRRITRG